MRAFFRVAYKRQSHVSLASRHPLVELTSLDVPFARPGTIDNVPQAIQNRLIDAFSKRIHDATLEELRPSGEGSEERCRHLLQHKRDELITISSCTPNLFFSFFEFRSRCVFLLYP